MEIKTLRGVKTKDILNVFNESFADYYIPFHLSKEGLISKMSADKVNLDVSVGVFEKDNLVAFILHGFDTINGKKVLYNAGTGVIPRKRGSGLTRRMYRFILPLLVEKGIDELLLEVIKENTQAIKSYEKSGYKVERELICYRGEISISNAHNTNEIKNIRDYDWDLMESFWDISPTWQNSKNVVNELRNSNISLGAYIEEKLVGYVIYNPKNKRLQQIAVDKKFRQRKIASSLIVKLIETYGSKLSIINIDRRLKSINVFLKKIGLEKSLEQLEMKLQLRKN